MSIIRADFIHKEAYITAFLAFSEYLKSTDYDLNDYRHYYQLKGDKSTAISVNGKNIRPDGIWWVTSHEAGAKDFVYVVEIHRHSERKHIIRQLRQQVEAIKEKSVQKRFGFDHPYLVLSVFTGENLTAMQGILAELKQSDDWVIIEKFSYLHALKTYKGIFMGGWGILAELKSQYRQNFVKQSSKLQKMLDFWSLEA